MDLIERCEQDSPRHPWEVARLHFVLDVLRNHGLVDQPTRLLDIGAGDAWMSEHIFDLLPEGSAVTCWDVNYGTEELDRLSVPGRALHATASRPSGLYDGVLMLDVMEHVEDDRALLENALDLVVDSGWVLVTVPAHQALFTSHDTALLHHRRYSPSRCHDLLASVGLQVISEGGLFSSLLAPRAAQALRERLRTTVVADESMLNKWNGGEFFTRAVTEMLDLDWRISVGLQKRLAVRVPGLSYWAFCRRVPSPVGVRGM